MRGQIRAATPVNATACRIRQVILALAVVTVQVGASATMPAHAGSLSQEQDVVPKIVRMAQNRIADPGNPVRIRELPVPKIDETLKSEPDNPARTEQGQPPSATENTPTNSTDKPK
jgi:hypothetical protein